MKRIAKVLMVLLLALPASAQQAAFSLPAIPDSLQTQEQRLAYVVENYWTGYPFDSVTDDVATADEQAFVDFVYLLQHVEGPVLQRAVNAFGHLLSLDERRVSRFEPLVDHYLGSEASPMRSDSLYAALLLALPPTPQRTFLAAQLMLNQPGTAACDFAYTDALGHPRRLYDTQSDFTLIVFHDPDCHSCHALLPRIRQSRLLQLPAQRLTMLFLTEQEAPEAWQHYYLPSLPSLYLLDAAHRVVKKQTTIEEAEALLTEN